MTALERALEELGDTAAEAAHRARLQALLEQRLARGAAELHRARSGYDEPLLVAFAATDDAHAAACPLPAAFRSDPHAVPQRGWALAGAVVDALVATSQGRDENDPPELRIRAGATPGGHLVLALEDQSDPDPELATLALDEAISTIDRLRATAVVLPVAVLAPGLRELKAPIGATHPLRFAEALARTGDEEAALALIGGAARDGAPRPHDDPDPARRVARRILQRLDGMGKWGGFHTDFAHLARGFAGNERRLADEVGEALLAAGLLEEKPSVGQRHVFLNPRRAGEIRRLIDDGEAPPGLALPHK